MTDECVVNSFIWVVGIVSYSVALGALTLLRSSEIADFTVVEDVIHAESLLVNDFSVKAGATDVSRRVRPARAMPIAISA